MTTRLILFLLLALATTSPAAEPRFDDACLAEISQRMNQCVTEGKISGAVTLIATKDKVVHLAATGKADIAANRPMEPDTIFRVASMTKPITSTALMLLIEQGKLAVDDPISKHIPAFAGQKLKDGSPARSVTIKDIMTHTAGLATSPGNIGNNPSNEQIANAIGKLPLEFAPGTKWQYSSGITIAGRLIEIASGESYADYLKKHIFDPLGMKDSTFQLTPAQAKRLAVTYKPGKDKGLLDPVEIPDPTQPRTPGPSGGLYSTAADMARFYQCILNGGSLNGTRLLSEKSTAEMLRIHTPGIITGFTPGNGWGLGWCVVEKPQGVTRLLSPGTFGHGGAWGTQGWTDPQRGLIFVLMIQRQNFGNSDASDVRDAFTEAAVTAYRGAESPTAKFVEYHGYKQAVELKRGNIRAVLCPEVGGRPLEFSLDGKNCLYLDDQEGPRQPGRQPNASAGRFDFGPELTTPPHQKIFSGEWTAEVTGDYSARLISQRDDATGVQLIRDFELKEDKNAPWLSCRQTIINISTEPKEYCHWGRSFALGNGLCFIPLAGKSRFPSKYALYEDGGLINVKAKDDNIRERDGFLEILGPPRKPKLGFDSYAGWLAYLMPGDLLFTKRFATYPDRVYNEAAGLTISVWYPPGSRVELEPIGPRERLAPGEAASFTEEWYLQSFPFPKSGDHVDLIKLRAAVEMGEK
ncbi:MAG TPA: serine hydrolase domain-containing protein [Pirellulaceae bacterium]|jgi:CubicO group peptidase (beta-lactamase class C family)